MPRLLATLFAMLLLATPSFAADSPSLADKSLDAAVFRPIGAISTLIGSILFVPAALFSLPVGKDAREEAWDTFVQAQWDSTFSRKLGEF
ncbi:MAG: hypothetical protein CBC48_15990 [bacterium TMED88]|nr:hypothetical protein [Deltaproteobacteria bacterium]OUV25884.1 MAG: hypothetical protein CBC48_15990 [bacterium TMED88]